REAAFMTNRPWPQWSRFVVNRRDYGHPRAVHGVAPGAVAHGTTVGGCANPQVRAGSPWEVGMQTARTPRMLSTVRKAAPVLSDAGSGVGVALLLLVASSTGFGPPWIPDPRPLDAVAFGLVGVVAVAVALRRRYPIPVLLVLNAAALAWSAAQYPGRLI